VPAEARLYSNDVQLEYYSQHFGRDIYTARRLHRAMESTLQNQLTQFDYAALRIRNNQDRQLAARMNDSRASIVKEFVNQHGDQVIIYKMSQQAAQ
jgi:mRNA-degrading endonuclease YafQ of YafQ-DinJ toxin-antitoxin module